MRRALLFIVATALAAANGFATAPRVGAQTSIPVQIGKLSFSTVDQWEGGTREGLLVSNNANGELRLAENRAQGVFTTGLTKTDFSFNAVGAVWRADVPQGTTLTLEVRGGPTANELGAWQRLAAGDARSQTDDGALALESVRPFPAGTAFLQFRATFSTVAANASPVLSEVTLNYLDATDGPKQAAGLPQVPAPYGPATLTAPPLIIQRESWGAGAPNGSVTRQTPAGMILHQIGTDGLAEPLPFLRALAAYHTQVLGWNDIPFHFIVDGSGNIYAGHSGGPTATVARFAAGDAAIHVALIGSAAPPAPQQAALAKLLAWLGQAYAIAPTGQHMVASGASATARPNIATHADVVPDAADPSPELRALAGALRQSADQATVRARWYFAEGNTFSYVERLSVLNPSAGPANVRFTLLRQPGPAVLRDATVAPGGRADLVVNNIFSDTTDVPAVVESNAPVIAERYMDFGNDIISGVGVSQPSRVWYFAEGSTETDNRTFLLLFNPQTVEVGATITYMRGDGTVAEQSVRIPPLRRNVVAVGDLLPDATFGARVIATQPIVAERTMIFGTGSTLTSGGVHSTPGVVTLSRRWFFAEGTTQAPFQMWMMVLNPNAQSTAAAVTFLTPDGTSLTRQYAIPPTTRLAINVNEVVPDLGVATTVVADRPVAVERAMYWKDNSVGTATAGATAPAFTWRFADGRTSGDFQEFLLLSNPNKNQARVTVDFVQGDGRRGAQTIVMPGGSRYTMAVHQLYPGQQSIAATVQSTQPIVAERSLYPGSPSSATNRGGATALGAPEAGP